MKLYTHLNFGGNCEEAFHFYAELLGGRVTTVLRVSDMPEGAGPPGASQDDVIHARVDLADVELVGNDVPADRFEPVRSSYLYLSVDSPQEAERIYSALSEGGKVGIPLGETFFASRFAQLRDRFGTLWTLLHELPRPQ